MKRKADRWIHEGDHAAIVEIELLYRDSDWLPYISLKDANKLDDVRQALQAGDLVAASRFARVYELLPVILTTV